MTVSSSYSTLTYNGNDVTTAFSVTWPFFTGTLVVTLIDDDGVETVKSLGTHYTVTGGTDSNGLPAVGTVTMLTAPATGEQLRIQRVTPRTQSSSWTDTGAFGAKTLEAALDRLTLIGQEGGSAGSVNDGIAGDVIELVSSGATNYWDVESQILRNVADPTAAQDAVTKAYGDANYGGAAALAAAASATSAASSAVSAAASAQNAEDAAALFEDLWQGNWQTATAYTKNQTVRSGGDIYICTVSHTSGASTEPGVGGSWDDYWDLQVEAPSSAISDGDKGDITTSSSGSVWTIDNDAVSNAKLANMAESTIKGRAASAGTGDPTDLTATEVKTLLALAATDVSGVLAQGKHTIFIPASAMISRTTNGAASGTTELTTNDVMLKTLDFDTTTEEGAGFWIGMPKSWNEGTVTFEALWTAASGSGGVAWGLAGYSFSNDDAMDAAPSGQQIVTDTLLTANDMHITSESSAITIGGTPAAGDVVYFEVTREVANGSDTLAVDAKLIGLRLFYTSDASTDA